MTNGFAPADQAWRFNRETGEMVLYNLAENSAAPAGAYTNHDMAKELIAIARNEVHPVAERLQAYQVLVSLADMVTRASR